MSSSCEIYAASEEPIEVIFEQELSSEEPPCDEWSSLLYEQLENNVDAATNLHATGSEEICAKYITVSDSFVLRHPYYQYPPIPDPGIKEALFHAYSKFRYPDDGQELYLDLCKENEICPIKKFYKNLVEDVIDLRFYGISLAGIRPMAMALQLNRYVKVLDLTDNWINEDGCFHLGEMLVTNITLTDLNLSGCRIGTAGARVLCHHLPLNRSLKVLNLSKNKLGDSGLEHFAKAISKGADVCNINLSYNDLTSKGISSLNEALTVNNKLTHLNLSWNSILSPNEVYQLCLILSKSLKFEELNFSWNSLSGFRVGNGIKLLLLRCKTLRRLILNNNRLSSAALRPILKGIPNAPVIELINLSYNPLTIKDALSLLLLFNDKQVKLQQLELEGIIVSQSFVDNLKLILKLKNRKHTVVTYGDIKTPFVPQLRDMREIAFNRADAIGKSSKKNPKDVALIMLEMFEEADQMDQRRFGYYFKSKGVALDNDLIDLLTKLFPGAKTKDSVNVDLRLMVDYIKRRWPDRKLPPGPPPELLNFPQKPQPPNPPSPPPPPAKK